jgi:membrane fusion protein (multidrug efflux system)
MRNPFPRTLSFLESEERFRPGRFALLVALVALVWGAWMSLARTHVYAVSEDGRLLAAGAASPVQTPALGVIVENHLSLGAEVQSGDVLVQLDVQAELLRKAEEESRLTGLRSAAESLEVIIEAERSLAVASSRAATSRVASAATRAKVAADVAAITRQQDEAMKKLKEASLASGLDVLKTAEAMQAQRGQVSVSSAEAAQASADVERARKEADVRLLSLARELTELRSRVALSQTAISLLDYEIARRTLRAPIGGTIADVVPLPKGAAVTAGQVLGTIVPKAPMRWIAYFPPREAVGRIREGQQARIRLDAFPWTAYGALDAKVLHVGSEAREQRVRVELVLSDPQSGIPLTHGMTGSTDITVEELSPGRLFLRLIGQVAQGSRIGKAREPAEGTPAQASPSQP